MNRETQFLRAAVASILCTTLALVGCSNGPYDHMPPGEKNRCEAVEKACYLGRSPFFSGYVEKLIQQHHCATQQGCEPHGRGVFDIK